MNPNGKRRTRLGERARRARPLAFAILLARSVGWIGIALGLGVSIVERLELAENWLQDELSQRLAPLGSEAHFDTLRVDWLGPGITLEGLRISKDGVTHLTTDRLYVAIGLSASRGVTLSRLDLDGGVLLVREPLVSDVRALLELSPDSEDSQLPQGVRLPSVQVRGFRVDFEGPAGLTHTLGSIDFSLTSKPRRPSRISGRLLLPQRPDASEAPAVHLHGVANQNGHLELLASAKDLRLEDWHVPRIAALGELLAMNPSGRLSLQSSGHFDLTGRSRPDLELRLALEGARLEPPLVGTPLESLALHLLANFDPAEQERLEDLNAWSGGGTFSGSWAGQALEGGLRLGSSARPGALLEGWVRAPELTIETPEIMALKPHSLLIRNLYDSLTPSGVVDLRVGLTCRDDWRRGDELDPKLELVVRVVPRSQVHAAWHGWYLPEFPDEVPFGFPMPAITDEGAVYFARNARFPRRALLDVDFRATHATGPARVTFQSWSNPIDMPPFAPGYGVPESDLFVIVPSIAINEQVKECMYGLRQEPALETLFDDYGLKSGHASAVVRVATRASLPRPAVDVLVDVGQVEAAWAELPIPAHDVSGRIRVRTAGGGLSSISYDVTATTDSAERVHIRGRQRHRGSKQRTQAAAPPPTLLLDALEVEAASVDLLGDDIELLSELLPGLGGALDAFAPEGRCDAALTRVKHTSTSPFLSTIEISPRPGLLLRPRQLPMKSEGVDGRVIVEMLETPTAPGGEPSGSELEAKVTTRITPLTAHWAGDVPVSLTAEFPSEALASGDVRVAGLRPGDASLMEDLARALGRDGQAVTEELDGLMLTGALDIAYSFEESAEDLPLAARYDFYLRDNDLTKSDGAGLNHLAGKLEFDGSELHSEAVQAELNGTPLTLTDLRMSGPGGGLDLHAVLHADSLTLDRPFLLQFLDAETVSTLIDQFGLRGSVDITAARAHLGQEPGGGFVLTFSGHGTISNVSIEAGLPVSIRSAQFELKDFVISAEGARAWGQVHDLYGLILDRDISQANLLLSYYGSRLSIDTLEGMLCQGRIHGARDGEDGDHAAGPAFSVDLRQPFAFQANVAFEDLDLSLLLEDVFASEIANKGFASGEARLQGELANLLSITGQGWGEVRDSVLWSVPVLRDLFSQLGYDATAVFDDMRADFRVEDGLAYMENMSVHSPLLNLTGRGTLGLDGTLHHDLQVKYSLVDKAGPLGKLIHLLQNTLLSISIRGDMARPKVFLRGALTGPFQSVDENWRALPLPGFSPLPERF